MDFISQNWMLMFLALSAGLMLALPNLRGASGINVQQAVQLINREKAVVIDVCSPEEAAQGHVAGSMNLPLSDLAQRLPKAVSNKDRPLILVCAAGMRAKSGAAIAKGAGYSNVHVLSGGLKAWREANLPIERG